MKYSHELNSKVETQIPDSILNAMTVEGWNAFGIYELVKRLRAKEQRNLTNHCTGAPKHRSQP